MAGRLFIRFFEPRSWPPRPMQQARRIQGDSLADAAWGRRLTFEYLTSRPASVIPYGIPLGW
jgi:hypothetical protein